MMRGFAIAAVVVCAPPASRAADLLFDMGAGPMLSNEQTTGLALRGSLGMDFGIVEPGIVGVWCPGSAAGPVTHFRQQGAQLLRGIAAILRVHTRAPHQLGVGVGFGSGRMEAAQLSGVDAVGYRGTAGPYTVIEVAYRYTAGPVTVGAAFTTHFFTHVQRVGDIGSSTPGPYPYGLLPFWSLMANVGFRAGLF
jgi:hypothetical protein